MTPPQLQQTMSTVPLARVNSQGELVPIIYQETNWITFPVNNSDEDIIFMINVLLKAQLKDKEVKVNWQKEGF